MVSALAGVDSSIQNGINIYSAILDGNRPQGNNAVLRLYL